MTDKTRSNPDCWVDEHGDVLFRYALLRVRDQDVAEDLVQETFVAALRAKYAGQSSERTWLTGILKHKIIDYLRKLYREQPFTGSTPDQEADTAVEGMFDRWQHWDPKPRSWSNPRAALEEQEFWHVLRECMDALPGRQADAFNLCVVEQLSGEEVRNVLGVTATNLGAMLHRARLRLRQCLDVNWFHRPGKKKNI